MKKVKGSLVIILAIILFIQVTTSQEVVASTEKSQVGITFEGSLPQNSENTTNSAQQEPTPPSNEGTNQKYFPKTNEHKNYWLIGSGLGLILISLCLIGWKKKKERTK